VQEELRKRNLFFGDVDGNTTPALISAIKKYQARKGFAVTGDIDQETAGSLHLVSAASANVSTAAWPNVPVLRSDVARAVAAQQQFALEPNVEDTEASPAAPSPPSESPPPVESISEDRVKDLVESYLHDAETQDVPAQVRYYAFPVEYFDHGNVDQTFVTRDTRNYVNRWPSRKYMLTDNPRIAATGRDGELNVTFTIAFTVKNQKHTATGRTLNFWRLRSDGNELKIASIREQRIRE
jgi:peptidoglycan hydrolase-like protein with peptidoglycan-binding domain